MHPSVLRSVQERCGPEEPETDQCWNLRRTVHKLVQAWKGWSLREIRAIKLLIMWPFFNIAFVCMSHKLFLKTKLRRVLMHHCINDYILVSCFFYRFRKTSRSFLKRPKCRQWVWMSFHANFESFLEACHSDCAILAPFISISGVQLHLCTFLSS